MGEISLLLGAGFSVNKGYPTANQLNDRITNLKETEFSISSDGTVFFLDAGRNAPNSRESYYTYKLFFIDFIKFYSSKKLAAFNYEEFYDYYHAMLRDAKYDSDFIKFCNAFRKEHHTKANNHSLLHQHNLIYNQVISSLLTDEDGNQYYKPSSHLKPTYSGYTGFLNCLEYFAKENTAHIHTLNHDLFFESLNDTQWINGELSDGFNELGSPYYGTLDGNYTVRLRYFSQDYDSKYRLYKLHGSVDQYPYHIQGQGIDNYFKIKYGIDGDYLKEVEKDGKLKYFRDWINYHADFLSGTTSKILRYREPLYYNVVFEYFERNLSNSDKLIIIGYGCGDSEVNVIIERHYRKENPIYVVNPYPNEQVYHFCEKLDAKLIKRGLEELTIADFQ